MKTKAILIMAAYVALAASRVGSSVEPSMTTTSEKASVKAEQAEKALLGTGCFWCSEAVFQRINGVKSVASGYAGGRTKNPSYQQICAGDTGHAEVVQIVFDPAQVTYEHLLDLFWHMHDPTTLNRQGGDVGTQYRSVIFYYSEAQKKAAEASKAALAKSGQYKDPIVTAIVPATEFYPAGDYHKDYFNRNSGAPYCRFVIEPKLKKLGMDKR